MNTLATILLIIVVTLSLVAAAGRFLSRRYAIVTLVRRAGRKGCEWTNTVGTMVFAHYDPSGKRGGHLHICDMERSTYVENLQQAQRDLPGFHGSFWPMERQDGGKIMCIMTRQRYNSLRSAARSKHRKRPSLVS